MEKSNIEIRNDIRFFTLYALFNGPFEYREEYGKQMTQERVELIEDLSAISAKNEKEYINKLKEYWNNNELHIYWYIYYTAHCKNPPTFKLEKSIENIEYDKILEMMNGFDRIIAEFYKKYTIQEIYDKRYETVIKKYIDRYNREQICSDRDSLHEYLKINNTIKEPKIIIVPLPFESHYSGKCVITDKELYILESSGAQSDGLNTHEYLHFFINRKVDSMIDLINLPIAKEYAQNRERDYVRTSYDDLNTFISENIVRAIDHRISDNKRNRKTDFKVLAENGLSLVEYFYNYLDEYEKEETRYKDIYDFIEEAVKSYKI